MRRLFTNALTVVAPGEAVSGIARQARPLRILRGCAWVTVEGMTQDYWLFAGDTLDVPPGRLIVVEAAGGPGRLELASEQSRSIAFGLTGQLHAALAMFRRIRLDAVRPEECATTQCSRV